MSANRQASPLRLLLYLAGAVIAVSLLAPSTLGVLGPVAVFAGLAAIYFLMFKRPVGRPSSDAARRLSGYRVRDGFTAIPDSVLLALAVWSIAELLGPSMSEGQAIGLGLIAGLLWAVLTRLASVLARDAVEPIISSLGLAASVWSLITEDQCASSLSESAMRLGVFLIVASLGVALAIRAWKFATLRKAQLSSFFLAALGLLELVEFAIAPAGQDIIANLSDQWLVVALVAGVLLAAALCAVNPDAAKAMIGVGVAVGGSYLLLVELQESGVVTESSCAKPLPKLVMVAAFTLAAVTVGQRAA